MVHVPQRSRALSNRGLTIAALCLAMGTGVTGCANSSHDVAARAPGATAAARGGPSGGPTGQAIPPASKLPKLPQGVSTARPKDPLAPATIDQVMRNGKKVHPSVRVKGGVQPFTNPIIYTDGLRLTITKMTRGTVTGAGPGVFPGRPVTDFHVTLANDTQKALPLGVVVVTVTYGSPARFAHLVYDKNSADFTGPIPAGQSGKAVYGFSIPSADLDNVRMTVDLDGVHQFAVFKGKVK